MKTFCLVVSCIFLSATASAQMKIDSFRVRFLNYPVDSYHYATSQSGMTPISQSSGIRSVEYVVKTPFTFNPDGGTATIKIKDGAFKINFSSATNTIISLFYTRTSHYVGPIYDTFVIGNIQFNDPGNPNFIEYDSAALVQRSMFFSWHSVEPGGSPGVSVFNGYYSNGRLATQSKVQIGFYPTPAAGVVGTTTAEKEVALFPNPATMEVTVPSTNKVEVFDLVGRRIEFTPLAVEYGKQQIDVSRFQNGLYWVKINGTLQKLIVAH